MSRRANSVEVRLHDLPGPRVLTFIDSHYPGWKAYVDGSEAPILLANDAFKAVVVPAGTHEVRFVFRPMRVYTGLVISVLAVIGTAIFLFIAFHKREAREHE